MSKICSLIVLCPNGRRETVKVSSNSSVLQVLEEACAKQDLKPEDFDIWHYKKCMDLSLPIRFANLPNNALLELHPAKNSRKDCIVTIALQLETGERYMKEFTPSATLFDVIVKCLQTESLSSQENGEPVCIYMRQKITGDAIKTVTLRSLGLTQGTAIIRLLYRKPEQLENQAHVSNPLSAPVVQSITESILPPSSSSMKIEEFGSLRKETNSLNEVIPPEPDKTTFDVDNNKHNSSTTIENERLQLKEVKQEQIDVVDITATDDQSERMDCDEEGTSSTVVKNETVEMDRDIDTLEEPEEIGDINYIGERHAVLYSLDDITEQKKADLSDEFFELTIHDVRYLLETYKKERMQLENQPLLTKEQRERQLLQKLACYSQTIMRIYFPERLVLQAVFNTTDTIQTVINFLREFLENKEIHFYLYTTPPKEKLSISKNLLECMLVPAAVIYFGCDTQFPSYLAPNLRQQKSDPRAAALAASESRKKDSLNVQLDAVSNDTNTPIKIENSLENSSLSGNECRQPPGNLPKSGKVPKWMRLSKQ